MEKWLYDNTREYIKPYAFDLGNKAHESAMEVNSLIGVVYSLLKSEWKGDRIIFLGDEIPPDDYKDMSSVYVWDGQGME